MFVNIETYMNSLKDSLSEVLNIKCFDLHFNAIMKQTSKSCSKKFHYSMKSIRRFLQVLEGDGVAEWSKAPVR